MWPIWWNKFIRLCHVYVITLLFKCIQQIIISMMWNELFVSFFIIRWAYTRTIHHTPYILLKFNSNLISMILLYKSIVVHDFTLTFLALTKIIEVFRSILIEYMNRLFSIVIEKFKMLHLLLLLLSALSSVEWLVAGGWNVEFNNRMDVRHRINAGMNDNVYMFSI